MFLDDTRYKAVQPFTADAAGDEPFPGVRARPIGPASGVLEHTVQAGDRLDHLARHFYGNDRLWWRIVDANPDLLFAGTLLAPQMEGAVILIPRAQE